MEIKSSLTTPASGGFSRTPSPDPRSRLTPATNYNKVDENLTPSHNTQDLNSNINETQITEQESKHNNDTDSHNDVVITNMNSDDPNHSEFNPHPEIKFKLGDRIQLETVTGKTGVVKFIGKTNFSKDNVVGLELDKWNPNASNGTINGTKILDTLDGRSWFLRRCSVSFNDFIPGTVREGRIARLTALQKVPSFNGKRVKVIGFVPRKYRWKVKLLETKNERKYLGVRVGNLDPVLDWECSSKGNNNNNNDDDNDDNRVAYKIEDIRIGDAVEMRNKKWGVVKYIGDAKWQPILSDDDDRSDHDVTNYDEPTIGLELIKWSPNANNGCVKDVCYFKANNGFGYFTYIDDIIGITRNHILWKQERIIWIAFNKNTQNLKCLIVKLPKDIIKYILTLVGHRIK